jgi:hypothetical protein
VHQKAAVIELLLQRAVYEEKSNTLFYNQELISLPMPAADGVEQKDAVINLFMNVSTIL